MMACTASSFFARPGRDLRSAAVRPMSFKKAWMAASVGLQVDKVAQADRREPYSYCHRLVGQFSPFGGAIGMFAIIV